MKTKILATGLVIAHLLTSYVFCSYASGQNNSDSDPVVITISDHDQKQVISRKGYPSGLDNNAEHEKKRNKAQYVPGQLIVKFKDTAAEKTVGLQTGARKTRIDSIEKLHGKYRVHKIDPLFKNKRDISKKDKIDAFSKKAKRVPKNMPTPNLENTYILSIDESSNVEEAVKEYKNDPNIEYAEPNYTYTASMLPNDPYYGNLQGLRAIQAEQAWDISQGEGVVVAVVDTGIDYNHEDISANIWINTEEIPDNSIDDDGNGVIDDVRGWNFANGNNNVMDDHGHGTHVAGIIAAIGNNATGIIGVAPKAKVMAVKGLDSNGIGYTTNLALALQYAADNGADVINNSWGGIGLSKSLEDAINYAYSKGCVVLAAAGNDSLDRIGYRQFMPASYQNVISIGANPYPSATFSNFGNGVDVFAPGYGILSLRASGTSMGTPLDEKYTRASGTSMACPHAVGLAALILAKNPELNSENIRHTLRLTAKQILPGDKFNRISAYGDINALDALSYEADDPMQKITIKQPSAYQLTGEAAGEANIPIYAEVEDMGCKLSIGQGEYPTQWTELASFSQPVDETIYNLDTSALSSGFYTLRLQSLLNNDIEDRKNLIVTNEHGWNINNKHGYIYSIKPADINNDGKDETIVCSNNLIYALDQNGQCLPNWPKPESASAMTINIEDIDNDGYKEIITARLGKLTKDASQAYIVVNIRDYLASGSELSIPFPLNYPNTGPDPIYIVISPYLACEDINNDGTKEMIYCLFYWYSPSAAETPVYYKILVFNSMGQALEGWPQEGTLPKLLDDSLYWSELDPALTITDTDKDGLKEIMFITCGGRAKGFGYNGATKPEWDKFLLETQDARMPTYSGIFSADINNDKDVEVIACATKGPKGQSPHKFIYVWDKNGALVNNFPRDIGENYGNDRRQRFMIADLDNDDDLEIISEIGVNGGDSAYGNIDKTKIYALHYDGTVVSGFPTQSVSGFRQSSLIADINNDGFPEIILQTTPAYNRRCNENTQLISAFDNHGVLLPSFELFYFDDPFEWGMCIADTDNDKNLNLIVAGNVVQGSVSRLYNFNLDSYDDFSKTVRWGMFQYNTTNTNTMTVNNVNSPPVFDPITKQIVYESRSVEFVINAKDPDGDALTYSVDPQTLPPGATFNDRTFTWPTNYYSVPGNDHNSGISPIMFHVTDGKSSGTIAVDIEVHNMDIDVNQDGNINVGDWQTTGQAIAGLITDPETLLRADFNRDGRLTAADWSWSGIVVKFFNKPPVIDPIGNKTVDEGKPLEFIVKANDPNLDTLTYSVIGLPPGAVFADQRLSWTPTLEQAGDYPVTFSISDGLLTAQEAITITVNNVAPPVAPSNLVTTYISTNQIKLGWTDNNSAYVCGFKVERSADGINFIEIGGTTSSAYRTSYSDINLAPGKTYHYRVCAYIDSSKSGYSNILRVTTSLASIAGIITDANGSSGLSGVTITFSPNQGSINTNQTGYYQKSTFTNGTYTVTPYKAGMTFTPAYRTVTINGFSVGGNNFAGKPATAQRGMLKLGIK